MIRLLAWSYSALMVFWMAGPAFGLDTSLSVTLAALLALCAAWVGGMALLRRRLAVADPPVVLVLLAGVFVVSSSFLLALWRSAGEPLSGYVFSFGLGLQVFLLPLLVLVSKVEFGDLKTLIAPFACLYLITLVASIVELFLLRTGVLSPQAFWVYPRFNAILFADQVRIPGVFSSGGANGFFLLIASVVLVARLVCGTQRLNRVVASLFWSLLLINAVVMYYTYTRKVYVLAAIGLGLVVTLQSVARIREGRLSGRSILLGGSVMSATTMLGVIAMGYILWVHALTQLTDTTSLGMRLSAWQVYLSRLIDEPSALLLGFHVTQEGLGLARQATEIAFIDNMYLSVTFYGGLLLLIVFLLFLGLLCHRLWRAIWADAEHFWVYVAALTILCLFVLHGFLSVTWTAPDIAFYIWLFLAAAVAAGHNRGTRQMEPIPVTAPAGDS